MFLNIDIVCYFYMFEASELPTQMSIAIINILYDFYIILMFYTTKNTKFLFQNIISFTVNTKSYLTKAIIGQAWSSSKESCSLVCAVTYACLSCIVGMNMFLVEA